jgi:hypothetical protein
MFVNFEYETHATRAGRPYIRGSLESITDKPKYQVFDFDLDAYCAVLVDGDMEKTNENVDKVIGYTMRYEEFIIKEEN